MADEYVFSQKDLDKMLDDALKKVEQRASGVPQQSLKDRLLALARAKGSQPK
jgi:hypothetical protein